MDHLRLILLLIGAAVIAGIYAWTRYQSSGRKRSGRSSAGGRQGDEAPNEDAVQRELERMQAEIAGEHPVAGSSAGEEQLLVVSVVAAPEQPFSGEMLGKAFDNNRLSFGEHSIFHRLVRRDGEDQSVFGVANMVKPGDFGNGDLQGFSSPGVTLFLQLPAPIDALEAFDDFVQTAERLAVELGGQLQDQKHCVITHQALMQQREALARSRVRAPLAS